MDSMMGSDNMEFHGFHGSMESMGIHGKSMATIWCDQNLFLQGLRAGIILLGCLCLVLMARAWGWGCNPKYMIHKKILVTLSKGYANNDNNH